MSFYCVNVDDEDDVNAPETAQEMEVEAEAEAEAVEEDEPEKVSAEVIKLFY